MKHSFGSRFYREADLVKMNLVPTINERMLGIAENFLIIARDRKT